MSHFLDFLPIVYYVNLCSFVQEVAFAMLKLYRCMDEYQKECTDTVCRRTDKTMAKRKWKEGQTTIYKILRRKQKLEQHEHDSWDLLLNDKQKL